MNLNKNKNSHIEMLLFAVVQELRNEMKKVIEEKTADLTAKINVIDERIPEDLLSIKEAAEFLGVSNSTLWRMRKSGDIKTYILGSQTYFKKSEIIKTLISVN